MFKFYNFNLSFSSRAQTLTNLSAKFEKYRNKLDSIKLFNWEIHRIEIIVGFKHGTISYSLYVSIDLIAKMGGYFS